MTATLSEFQDCFGKALWESQKVSPELIASLTAQPGFSIYRNTVLKACIDSLAANYPTILRLVGPEWFRQAATIHVKKAPPRDPRLAVYGKDFPQFLKDFPPAAELPYLSGVAMLDRCWTKSHVAANAAALEPAQLTGLPMEQLGQLVLKPHPAAHWAWFNDQPVFSIWQRNRDPASMQESDVEDIDWHGEGVLLTRSSGTVKWVSMNEAGCAFLSASASGLSLEHAAGAALAVNAAADLSQLMAKLLEAGALRGGAVDENEVTNEDLE